MKKLFLLVFFPIIISLLSCRFAETSNNNTNFFLEDTLAHEEIFDNSEVERFLLHPKYAPEDPIDHPNATDYSIGVQSKPGDIDGTICFRFIAPVTFSDEQLNPTQAKWTRTVSKKDGTAYPKDTDEIECATAYKAISNGDGAYSIDDYNDEHGTSFTHFVVYTLRNIPVDENDYYVSAYLTLSPKEAGGMNYVSKAVAINASMTQSLAYIPKTEVNSKAGAFFISGHIKGENRIIYATVIRAIGSNKAKFEYVDFDQGDTFVINEFYDTKLLVHGYTECLNRGGARLTENYEEGPNDTIKVKLGGNYEVILHYDNYMDRGLYDPYDQPINYYIRGTMNGWMNDENYRLYSDRTSNIGITHKIHLNADDEFRVYKTDNTCYGWHGDFVCSIDEGKDDNEKLFVSSGDNIKCQQEGDYYLYLDSNYDIWFTLA